MRSPDDAVRATWQCASLLLDYPGAALAEHLEQIRRTLPGLPARCAEPLAGFVAHAESRDLTELQQEYVATFDERRRCGPYLTYFAHGDTRRRGLALLRFQQAYRAAGVGFAAEELPDHLAVVLEFAATVDAVVGRGLLLDHRAGLETLRLALADLPSPWAGVLEAVCRTLPPLVGSEREAIARLAAQGPPVEEVGLTPYGAPGFDPASGEPRPATVDLPMPIRRGA